MKEVTQVWARQDALKAGYTQTLQQMSDRTGWSKGHLGRALREGNLLGVKVVAKQGGKAHWLVNPETNMLGNKPGYKARKLNKVPLTPPLKVFEQGVQAAEKKLSEAMAEDVYGGIAVLKRKQTKSQTVLDVIAVCRALLLTLEHVMEDERECTR